MSRRLSPLNPTQFVIHKIWNIGGSFMQLQRRNACHRGQRCFARFGAGDSMVSFCHRIVPFDSKRASGTFTGVTKRVTLRLRECCSKIGAEVVSNSRNKIHQTWGPLFGTHLLADGTFICLYFLPRPSFHRIERGGRLQTGFSCPKAFHWMRPRAIWGVAATFSGVFHMKQCQKPLLRNIA